MSQDAEKRTIRIRGGSIYLGAALCATYFRGLDAVAVLPRDGSLLIMPIRQHGGGLLLKIRNARGDRVVHAPGALATGGYPADADVVLDARWDSQLSALRASPAE